MKSYKQSIALFCATLSLCFLACKKENNSLTSKGKFDIEFDHQVANLPLVLNTNTYVNDNGDDFKISTFKYYISNIKLQKENNEIISLPETYFLIDESKEDSKLISLEEVPEGDYKTLQYTIGVDSARNFSGAQTGALDPANGMFWTWNSGYIFLKFEGLSTTSTATDKSLVFHIGGAKAPNNCIRTVSLNLPSLLRIRKNTAPEIHLIVDASTLFKGTNKINFSTLNFTMGGANSVKVADNYVNGLFKVDHIHN